MTTYLADTSAYTYAARTPSAHKWLGEMVQRGLIATCPMVELEMRYSARSPKEYDLMRTYRERYLIQLPVNEPVMHHALTTQAAMARTSQHRSAKVADLIIAAAAQLHGVTLLHHDKDFPAIADFTGQKEMRIE